MASVRIILTTGGTGGHIFPALAVAEQLRLQAPDASLLFMGSQYGPEARLSKEAGLEFTGLAVRGVLGRGLRAVAALAAMARAVVSARGILKDFQPDIVAGFGSYASMPALAAACLIGTPIAIHEQNAIPGLSNRLMARMARKVFLALPDQLGRFPSDRTQLVGNPVRGAIAALYNAQAQPQAGNRLPSLLVMGGSQGARAINSAVLAALPRLKGIHIRHQTGEADFERVKAGYQAHGFTAEEADVTPFITDMARAYAEADLVLCRSGATTVAELALAGKPSVLVPFPFATHDHQTGNARALEQAGAACLIQEKDMVCRDLAGTVLEILHDPARCATMGRAAHTCARPCAAKDVARGLLDLAAASKGDSHA
ncbi:MAG TPA: undecaprenyldiphospho-muramoylpentapeptide beta-N-acetylglucosaminyltransferase [Candidatus Avidesulfovibrio excrementigallinarum]|nr:undecaprenyldiphospho-muramoylpentapeptide beta-N-acetylglucosaminyltransferase [Candidatus Avidesulfovibrio excrementigallinarum]